MKKVLICIGLIALVVALSAFLVWVVMLLLNWIMGQVGLNYHFNYWTVWAISVVCNLLFGSSISISHNRD